MVLAFAGDSTMTSFLVVDKLSSEKIVTNKRSHYNAKQGEYVSRRRRRPSSCSRHKLDRSEICGHGNARNEPHQPTFAHREACARNQNFRGFTGISGLSTRCDVGRGERRDVRRSLDSLMNHKPA